MTKQSTLPTLTCDRSRSRHYHNPETGENFFSWSQIAEAMAPGQFDLVPDAILDHARERGHELHLYFATSLYATLGLCSPPEPLLGPFHGYANGIDRFIADHRPKPVLIERPSCCDELAYAGRPDALLWMQETLTLIDLKTGVGSWLHAVQVQVYRKMRGYEDARAMATLYVTKRGGYQLVPVYDDPFDVAAFMNGLVKCEIDEQLARWRESRGL